MFSYLKQPRFPPVIASTFYALVRNGHVAWTLLSRGIFEGYLNGGGGGGIRGDDIIGWIVP